MAAPKLLFLVSEDWFFWSHRLPIARAARDAGFEVVVACRMDRHRDIIAGEGFRPVALDIDRGSASPARTLGMIAATTRLYRRERPDLVHHVAIQMCLIGSIAGAVTGVPRIVNAFTGLGYLVIDRSSRARRLGRVVLAVLGRLNRRRGTWVVVQNADDEACLLDSGVAVRERLVRIRGAGVDIRRFRPRPEPAGVPMVVFVGRMLADKGLNELAEAARLLKAAGRQVRIVLVGALDPDNPAGLPEDTLRRWQSEGLLEWWGYRSDVAGIWREAGLAVLPSYREGLPKSLLEAAASAVPMVATDVPGCRELVRHGVNGLLVPARDPAALATAIATLLDDADLRRRLGDEARRTVEAEFSEEVIAAATLALYRRLLEDRDGA
jgi:glycosyltransferase involved in cell wall biosynthesis